MATKYKGVQLYKVSLVRDGKLTYDTPEQATLGQKVNSPADAAKVLAPIFQGSDREIFAVAMLDVKKAIIGINIASVGTLSSSLVHPREVFKPAILASAHSILVAHNHPSGDTTPGKKDIITTKRLKEAGELIGIELMDHLILGEDGTYKSLLLD